MAKAQTKFVDEIWKSRAPDLPIKSSGEMVTLASIVEKETGKADERPRVAGVFVNRLQKHMRLESDPTIVYGLVFGKGTLGHSISKAEVNQATPYNTYIIEGLPPGPISNPGKAALEAVAKPVRSRDLYFVADGTGGHVFANSFEQHLKNVARWRQIEKDAKDRLRSGRHPAGPPPPSMAPSNPPIPPRLARSLRRRRLARLPPRFSPASPKSALGETRWTRRWSPFRRRPPAASRSRSSALSLRESTTLRPRATRSRAWIPPVPSLRFRSRLRCWPTRKRGRPNSERLRSRLPMAQHP